MGRGCRTHCGGECPYFEVMVLRSSGSSDVVTSFLLWYVEQDPRTPFSGMLMGLGLSEREGGGREGGQKEGREGGKERGRGN